VVFQPAPGAESAVTRPTSTRQAEPVEEQPQVIAKGTEPFRTWRITAWLLPGLFEMWEDERCQV